MADFKWSNNAAFPPIATPNDTDQFVGLFGANNGKISLTDFISNYVDIKITVDLQNNVTGILPELNGGTGQSTYNDGELLIGKSDGSLALSTLTAGTNVTVLNGDGSITISTSGEANVVTSWDGSSSPVSVTAGTGIDITGGVISSTGDQSVTMEDAYNNSITAGQSSVNLTSSNPMRYLSPSADVGVELFPPMTYAQYQSFLPGNSEAAYATDLDRITINTGTSGSPNIQQLAYLADIASITADGAIGECYFNSNATPTVMIDTVTPVKVVGGYTSGTLVNMSHSGGTITNIGTQTLILVLTVSMTVSLDSSAGEINGYIYLNGITPQNNIEQQISIDGVAPSYKTLVLSGTITLPPSEYAEVFILNTTAVNNPTIQSLNFLVNTVGSAGGAGSSTLEEAYTSGDGSMTMTASKPIAVLSNNNGVTFTPAVLLEQLQIPANQQLLSSIITRSKNSAAALINYSEILPYSWVTTAGNESSRLDMFCYAAGSRRLIIRFDGSSVLAGVGGTLSLNCGTTLNNHNLIGIANLTQEVGSTTLNNSNTAVGRTEIKIPGSAGVIIDYTTPLAGMDVGIPLRNYTYGVNATMGTSILPQLGYTSGVFSPVWGTLNGSNIVLANSLQIGQTVSIECSGSLSAVTTGGTGILRASFGSAFSVSSSSINFSGFSGQRPFGLIFKVTMINATQVSASVSGWYSDTSNNLKSFNLFINPYFINFNPAINNEILLEWQPTFGAGNAFDFFANNLNIIKYS